MIHIPLLGRDPNKALFIGNKDNRHYFAKMVELGYMVISDGNLFAIPEMYCVCTDGQKLPGFVQFVNYCHIIALDQYGRLNYRILAKPDFDGKGLFLELIDDPFGEFVPPSSSEL